MADQVDVTTVETKRKLDDGDDLQPTSTRSKSEDDPQPMRRVRGESESSGSTDNRGRSETESSGSTDNRGRSETESSGLTDNRGRSETESSCSTDNRGRSETESSGSTDNRGRSETESSGSTNNRGRSETESSAGNVQPIPNIQSSFRSQPPAFSVVQFSPAGTGLDYKHIKSCWVNFNEKDELRLDAALAEGIDLIFIQAVKTGQWQGVESKLKAHGYTVVKKERASNIVDATACLTKRFQVIDDRATMLSDDLCHEARLFHHVEQNIDASVRSDTTFTLIMMRCHVTQQLVIATNVDLTSVDRDRVDVFLAEAFFVFRKMQRMSGKEHGIFLSSVGLKKDDLTDEVLDTLLSGNPTDRMRNACSGIKSVNVGSTTVSLYEINCLAFRSSRIQNLCITYDSSVGRGFIYSGNTVELKDVRKFGSRAATFEFK